MKQSKRRGAKRPRAAVALLIETSNQYTRELLHGIRAFIGQHGEWAIHLTEQGRGDLPPPWLTNWTGDGIIARIENELIEKAVRTVGVPVVNVSASGLAPDFPTVISDSAAVADLSSAHLMDCGFEHFGYCGDSRFRWSAAHARNFVRSLERQGYPCSVFESTPEDYADWRREQRKLTGWIQSLPKPVGIMACYDIRGQQVLAACRALGFQVPDDVAVIGQHNDELLCELCDPPLTSVIPNPRRAGYEAAALLHQMMRGRRVAARTHSIAPIGVATRQSTDIVALNDRQIAAAARFIREHAFEGIDVQDVLRAVPMSRTLLERKFRKYFRRAPYEEILHRRLLRAQELLAGTDLAVADIAERAGFSSPDYLSAAFKRQIGMNPRAYRKKNRSPE
jgi:LacI family transcriptional regulator